MDRPANPFDDTGGEWDPFKDAPPPKSSGENDLSSFFGDQKSSTQGEVPVLFPGQDSVWGGPSTTTTTTTTTTNTSDPFGAPSDPFGSSTGGQDPFGSSTGGQDP